MSGQKLDTEETCKQGSQNKQKEGTALEVTGATNQTPVVNITYVLEGAYRPWELQAGTRSYLKLNWPHTAHNSSREIPRYIFTIIILIFFI